VAGVVGILKVGKDYAMNRNTTKPAGDVADAISIGATTPVRWLKQRMGLMRHIIPPNYTSKTTCWCSRNLGWN
jgi:hypothetical protein